MVWNLAVWYDELEMISRLLGKAKLKSVRHSSGFVHVLGWLCR